jgi:von Willebrand factor type A domain
MARRKTETFSLSFLDVISCGFGAVVLFYTIVSAQAGLQRQKSNEILQSEVDRIEAEVLSGYKNLAVIRNSLEETKEESRRTEGLSPRIIEETKKLRVQLADAEGTTIARREAIERLKADLKSLEEGTRRLEGGTQSPGNPGQRIRGFVGNGDRQYLTGLKVGGERILILVDASASMLDETVVNVIRMRNMSEARKLLSEKWQRAVGTVDWLGAQIPEKSRFQIYVFNTAAHPLLAGSEARWLEGRDPKALNDSLRALRDVVPEGGTSLENALAVAQQMIPRPDNVILVTDGLPTQGATPPAFRKTIDGDGRLKLFERAFNKFPKDIPLNIILFPMEGDPSAASAFWVAARRTGGAFMSPSKDWP